ncbi:tetratricopeptide repeat protein [Sediminitomix flava]|uniref:Tetratricopeptide repeat protein n=1 Tax=Sediminitomix flava TaxID=379075 RepID=A0A315Z0L5_SEDFL|nr:tetratricopeptide repeat protein [Sediminitomix flava]PWJ36031.1 tetratricopeptide repeat protein [Sediminitomix flava]
MDHLKKKRFGLSFFLLFIITTFSYAQTQEIELANEYYFNGEYEKAIEYYEKALKEDETSISEVHKKYLSALINNKEFKKAQKYLKRQIRKDPLSPVYNVDYGLLYLNMKDSSKAYSHWTDYIKEIKKDSDRLRMTALYFIDAGKFEWAETSYKTADKINKNQNLYREYAELYYAWDRTDKMIDAYIEWLLQDGRQLEFIEVALQDRIKKDEDFDTLELNLIRRIQKSPNQIILNELLLWYYLQEKSFSKAFIQAKAIDKRRGMEGEGLLELGQMALNNQDYKASKKIFTYIVDKYKDKAVYPVSRKLLINTKEELVKHTYPVDKEAIRTLIQDYKEMLNEMGVRSSTADVMRNMALLEAFYLDNKDKAIEILNQLIKERSVPQKVHSRAKLDLGDIYLLKGTHWESTLLYSQVEKSEKESPLGHTAKLKNAKLNYYIGNFELAKAHLDILKMATTREISNDAMALSLLIQDNLELDTTATTMQTYASIDLLEFQGKYDGALEGYQQMLKDFPNHSLSDEILWQMGQIYLKQGKYKESINALQQIVDNYTTDIWGDDANYLIGTIYEEYLKDNDKAMEYYKDQLVKFKGSVYNVDARKRFRTLRGDNIN